MSYALTMKRSEFLRDVNHNDGREVSRLLAELPCVKCGQVALKLTKSRPKRLGIGIEGEAEVVEVGLARCGACKSRRRVLPLELLPGKSYALSTVLEAAAAYLDGPASLRKAAEAMRTKGTRPHFTTIHGWLGGLGERCLDQVRLGRQRATVGGKPTLDPFSGLLREAQTVSGTPVVKAFRRPQRVRSTKYRSERRREHLESVLRLREAAGAVVPVEGKRKASRPLCLERVGLVGFRSPMLLFRSRIRDTSIQQDSGSRGGYDGWVEAARPGPGDASKTDCTLALRANRGAIGSRPHETGAKNALAKEREGAGPLAER